MRHCPKCGGEVSDSAVFCSGCGESVTFEEAAPVSTETPSAEINEKEEVKSGSAFIAVVRRKISKISKKTKLITLIAGVSVLLVGIILFFVLFTPETPADEFEYYVDYAQSHGIVITGYNGNRSKVKIPLVIDNYHVTRIGRGAFENCTGLTEIYIPSTIECIDENAFSGCTSLRKVHLTEGLTTIGGNAFSGCTSLEKIELPDGLKSILWEAFSNCTSLKSITIPKTVDHIYESPFEGCNITVRAYYSSRAYGIGITDGVEWIDIDG